MEIQEILNYYLYEDTKRLEISFRLTIDSEDEVRNNIINFHNESFIESPKKQVYIFCVIQNPMSTISISNIMATKPNLSYHTLIIEPQKLGKSRNVVRSTASITQRAVKKLIHTVVELEEANVSTIMNKL